MATTHPATEPVGRVETSTPTIVHRFRERVDNQPARPALQVHDNGNWRGIDWGEYGRAVEEQAAGLIALGISPGDRVGILSRNRPEWHMADLAILSIGAITVPVYPTSSSSQVAYVLANSGARACFVGSSPQLAKVLLHQEQTPTLDRVIGLESFPSLDRDDLMIDIDQLRWEGRTHLEMDAGTVSDRVAALQPDDVATLVYTSGTTGHPKGTSITHSNIEWTISSVQSMVGLGPDDRFLSYLPLSHIAERVTSHFGQILSGGETWFAQSLATVPEDLRACRPTIFFAVPRVWQKFHDAMLDQIDEKPGPVKRAFETYLDLGIRLQGDGDVSRRAQLGYQVLDRVLGATLRKKVGLDEARMVVSSAAPIHPDLVRWFHALGLPIAEVWGQTEDCGPATMNPPDAIRIGTVGVAIPGLEVRTADDGEIQVRGGSVCAGYFGMPEATRELIGPDGWMGTGDLGSIDDDGYVTITGRKKDLIINAAGKNISPAEIEGRLSMEPLIGQAIVVGEGRRYLTALLTLDPDDAADWAEEHGGFSDIAALIHDPVLCREVEATITRVNREFAPVEQIKAWRLLPKALSVESGEVTPTLKVKRAYVIDEFATLVEEMYAEQDSRS